MTPIPHVAPYTRAQLRQDIAEGRPDWAEPDTPLTHLVESAWAVGVAFRNVLAAFRILAVRAVRLPGLTVRVCWQRWHNRGSRPQPWPRSMVITEQMLRDSGPVDPRDQR